MYLFYQKEHIYSNFNKNSKGEKLRKIDKQQKPHEIKFY